MVAVFSTITSASASYANTDGGLDCNGYSPISPNIIKNMVCADPVGVNGYRFYDNHHYIGHDEPSMQFFSNSSSSANNMKWEITLPGTDPVPNQSGTLVANAELYPTFWFSLALCDPNSSPVGPCTPNSDSNTASSGSAFLELQFYPPGTNCDSTHWCAALNIDSLERNATKALNTNCVEPFNFAYIQKDGIPTGPPGPGSQTNATFASNSNTLLMNPGDKLIVLINDTSNGLLTEVVDKTTGQSGYMVASSSNGFENTLSDFNTNTCTPQPFSFHPEFNTVTISNIVPWTALQANVNIAFEIGHFELGTDSDADDNTCVSLLGVTGCTDTDTDFDGLSYQADWPNGNSSFPSSVVIGAATGNGMGPISYNQTSGNYTDPYGYIRFGTPVGFSEPGCTSSSGCSIPPPGAAFYPFYTQQGAGATCKFNFGNDISGVTTYDFGKYLQYGVPHHSILSDMITNPCVSPYTICFPPVSGDWNVTSSCALVISPTAPANVIIQNGAVLTIPNGLSLNIDFAHFHLLVKHNSGVLIKAGGKIT